MHFDFVRCFHVWFWKRLEKKVWLFFDTFYSHRFNQIFYFFKNQSLGKKEEQFQKLSSEMRLADNGATCVSEVGELEHRSNHL